MGQRVLKQPDGNYAVWSTVVDDFLIEDLTASELEEWYVQQQAQKAREHIQNRIESWEDGESPYPGNTSPRTHQEAIEWKETLEGLD